MYPHTGILANIFGALPAVISCSRLFYWQVFDCKLHGCSQDLIFPVSSLYLTAAVILFSKVIYFTMFALKTNPFLEFSIDGFRYPILSFL